MCRSKPLYYAVASNDITAGAVALFDNVKSWLSACDFGPTSSCHQVCASLARQFGGLLLHKRGKFAGVAEHSWLELPPADGDVIIDPWPVAGGAPMLLYSGPQSPWNRVYKED